MSKKVKGGHKLNLGNETEKLPQEFTLRSTHEVRKGLQEENQSQTLRVIREAISLLEEKKKLTPSELFKVGMVLGECPRGLTPCIPELGQCGSAEDLKDEKRFPGGYRVWTTDSKYPVGMCIRPNDKRPTVAVPIGGIPEKQTALEREIERHNHLTGLLNEEKVKIRRLLGFMDHITNCEAFQEEEACVTPKLGSVGVTGKNADAPRCLWRNDTCGNSNAYEREIGALAERKLVEYNRKLKATEAKLRNNPYKFTLRTRRPVPLKGDDYSKKLSAAYDDWKNLTTQKDILEMQIYAMEEARVRAKDKLNMTQNEYIQYQALVSECQNALDDNRTWESCATSNGVCQVLVAGKGKGLMKKIDEADRKKTIDNSSSFCVPSMGARSGMFMHDKNTGRVYFFDNLGNLTSHTDPIKSWFGLRNWKLKNDSSGLASDAFLGMGPLASIAKWGGRLLSNDMDETPNTVDVEALRGNNRLAARARLLQRNMQMIFESLTPYIGSSSPSTILEEMSRKHTAGWITFKEGKAEQAVKKRGDYTKDMVKEHVSGAKPNDKRFLERMTDLFNKYADMTRLYNDTLEEISRSDAGLATRLAGADVGITDKDGNNKFQQELFAGRKNDIALAKAKAVLTYIAVTNFSEGEHAHYYWYNDTKTRDESPNYKWQDESQPRAPAYVQVVDDRPKRRQLWFSEGNNGNAWALWLNARARGMQHFDSVQNKFGNREDRLVKVKFGEDVRLVDIFHLRKEYYTARCTDVIKGEKGAARDLNNLERQIVGHSGDAEMSFCDRIVHITKNGQLQTVVDPSMNWANFHFALDAFEDDEIPAGASDDETFYKKLNEMGAEDLSKNMRFLNKALNLMQEQGMAVARAGGQDWTQVPSSEIMDAIRDSNNSARNSATSREYFSRYGRAAEETFDVESLSLMSTATHLTGGAEDVSLMSTATHLTGGAEDVSLMSTATHLTGGAEDVSLMSTATHLTGGAADSEVVSMFSTENGTNMSMMSTEKHGLSGGEGSQLSLGSLSLLSTEVPRNEFAGSEAMSGSAYLSGGEVDSVQSESVDVDALYEEYYGNMDGSSVSHIE